MVVHSRIFTLSSSVSRLVGSAVELARRLLERRWAGVPAGAVDACGCRLVVLLGAEVRALALLAVTAARVRLGPAAADLGESCASVAGVLSRGGEGWRSLARLNARRDETLMPCTCLA